MSKVNDLLRELTRAMHERFDRLERRMDDHGADMREIKGHMALLMRAAGWHKQGFVRIERHVDLPD